MYGRFCEYRIYGISCLLDVFGQEAVFYASLIHMAFNFFVYTYAIMCLTKGDDSEFKLNFKQWQQRSDFSAAVVRATLLSYRNR